MNNTTAKRKLADINEYIENLESFYLVALDTIDQLIDYIFLIACDEDFLTEDMTDTLDELQETTCDAAERFVLVGEVRG